MNIQNYSKYFTKEILMGPNIIRILEKLLTKHPLKLSENDMILDLGCGKGLTSLVLAKETGANVYANDLWIPAKENQGRFEEWGLGDKITAICQDANELSHEKNSFDALVSVDAYHYFGTGKDFFQDKILPFLKDGAKVLIGVPGVKEDYKGMDTDPLADWLGDDAYMFKSPNEWKEIIGQSGRIKFVETWEMVCFDKAWQDWLESGNEYALGDKEYFESHIKPYTCLVGISIQIKEDSNE